MRKNDCGCWHDKLSHSDPDAKRKGKRKRRVSQLNLKNLIGQALAHAHKSNGKSISFAVAWKVELILATIAYD